MICSSLNFLVLITIILRVDVILGKMNGTVYGEQVTGTSATFRSPLWLIRDCQLLARFGQSSKKSVLPI